MPKEYIEREAAKELLVQDYAYAAAKLLDYLPSANVVEVKCRNLNNENCVICNSELDEKYASGLWDLAGEICSIICPECDHDEQDTVYNLIRNYIEAQNYCPNCGAKIDKGGEKNA